MTILLVFWFLETFSFLLWVPNKNSFIASTLISSLLQQIPKCVLLIITSKFATLYTSDIRKFNTVMHNSLPLLHLLYISRASVVAHTQESQLSNTVNGAHASN